MRPGGDGGAGRVASFLAGLVVGAAAAAGYQSFTSGTAERAAAPPPVSTTNTGAPTTTSLAPTFESLIPRVRSGVVQVKATGCDKGGGSGSGFLLSSTHIATVAHVVERAVAVAVTGEDGVREAKVVGFDAARELALLEVETPFAGHVFQLASNPTDAGTAVAAIGYPRDLDVSVTVGAVSGTGREITVSGRTITGLIQTDAALNPGNSGGPLIDVSGVVVGLVEARGRGAEGIAFAVEASAVAPRFEHWKSFPQSPETAVCDAPTVPSSEVKPKIGSELGPEAPAVAETFARYFSAINRGRYEDALAELTPSLAARNNAEALARNLASTYDFNIKLAGLSRQPDGSLLAHVTFTSLQNPDKGPRPDERCTNWSFDYKMQPVEGRWKIDEAKGHAGGPSSARCA